MKDKKKELKSWMARPFLVEKAVTAEKCRGSGVPLLRGGREEED